MSLVNNDGGKIINQKDIFKEKAFCRRHLYIKKYAPNSLIFNEFLEIENTLSEKIAST